MIKKNDILEVNILNLGCNGEGVAKVDGVVLFIPYALPNERVKVQVINTKQKAYICKVLEVITPSPDREQPLCPYFTKCGGCQLQHLNYGKVLLFKQQLVQDAITHIGKIDYKVAACQPSNKQYYYRNKLALPLDSKNGLIGMFRTNSHSIVNIDNCYIQEPWCEDLIETFNEYIKHNKVSIYDESTQKGLLRHLVARQANGKLLITVVVNGDNLPKSEYLVNIISKKFDNFGLNININKTNSNIILTNDFKHIYGLKEIEIEEYGVKYSINNASFMQVNDYIKHKIYDEVLGEISYKDIVIDAYSGAGLLTAIMSKKCKFSYGIEIVKPAVDIANNLKICNNISNMSNICGDTTIELPKLIKELKDEFVVVLDPPRKGCSSEVMKTLAEVRPKKIIYISCNPSTLARDLKTLIDNNVNYKINKIKPFDMFPNTKHVESLAVLEREKGD